MTDDIAAARLRALRSELRRRDCPALYVTSAVSRRYLTGFSGTAGSVFITQRAALFFTDARYLERAEADIPSRFVLHDFSDAPAALRAAFRAERIQRMGIEDRELTLASYTYLSKKFRGTRLVAIGELLEELRQTKDSEELAALERAIAITDAVFSDVARWLRHSRRSGRLPTEDQVAFRVRQLIHNRRAELAFDTIVAAGPHGARPHHQPTSRRLRKGELVTIDLGAKVNGYHADMTRTVHLGPWTPEHRVMYLTCLRAQRSALHYLKRGGRSAERADAAARTVIEARYGGAFAHGLGHGVGLEVHELPTLSPKSKHRLKNGMVFSVEPGIYEHGHGGVRIEDLVMLHRGRVRELSRSPKDLKQSIV